MSARVASAIVLVAAISVAGCVEVSFVPTGARHTAPSRPQSQVWVYHAHDWVPPFTEIGYLELSQERAMVPLSVPQAIAELREQGRRHGCRAIILCDSCLARAGRTSRGTRSFVSVMGATCVLFDER